MVYGDALEIIVILNTTVVNCWSDTQGVLTFLDFPVPHYDSQGMALDILSKYVEMGDRRIGQQFSLSSSSAPLAYLQGVRSSR